MEGRDPALLTVTDLARVARITGVGGGEMLYLALHELRRPVGHVRTQARGTIYPARGTRVIT